MKEVYVLGNAMVNIQERVLSFNNDEHKMLGKYTRVILAIYTSHLHRMIYGNLQTDNPSQIDQGRPDGTFRFQLFATHIQEKCVTNKCI